MLASFLLALREGLEAALLVGIVLGALRQIRRTELAPSVWAGVLSAAVVSLLTSGLLTALGLSLEAPAEQIFEGLAMFLAAGVLTWMIFWMNRQARHLKSNLENDVREAALKNGRNGLFALAFLAVVREGVELALFLTAASLASTAAQTVAGALLGLVSAALLGWAFFASTHKLDLRRFFQVTGVLLILFAAGLVAHGVHELNEIGWIPSVVEPLWNLNPLLDEKSTLGELLKALFGYNGNPSLTEMLAYLAYFGLIALGLRQARPLEAQPRAVA